MDGNGMGAVTISDCKSFHFELKTCPVGASGKYECE